MRRWLFRSNGNGRRPPLGQDDSLISLELPAAADVVSGGRHLTDQQLVDFVIGSSSQAGKLHARRHLAACSHCRQDLNSLRGVDRQLERQDGGHRLAEIPRLSPVNTTGAWIESARLDSPPAAARGIDWVGGGLTTFRRWQRVVVPLMLAASTLVAIKVAVDMSEASALVHDRETEVAGFTARPPGPMRHGFDTEAPLVHDDIEAIPAAVEVNSPVVASTERVDDNPGTSLGTRTSNRMSPGVSVAAPRRAGTTVRKHVDTVSLVTKRRHPGAGRSDDRVSPPPRELGV